MASSKLSLPQLYGRIGGLRLRATHDPAEYTAAGRRAFLSSFEREVDPDGTLPPAERATRAEAARRAYMATLAYRRAAARRSAAREDQDRIAALERRLSRLEGSASAPAEAHPRLAELPSSGARGDAPGEGRADE